MSTLAHACPGFGEVLSKHLTHGTRPYGNTEQPGKRWSTRAFADAVCYSERTVRHWLNDRHLPGDIETIERVLFGLDYTRYPVWRLELRKVHMIALRSARLSRMGRRRRKDMLQAA